MTLEEMIRFMEQDRSYAERDVPHNVPKYEAIIAALRAGQALYDACALDDMDEESTIRMDAAMEAWDAATNTTTTTTHPTDAKLLTRKDILMAVNAELYSLAVSIPMRESISSGVANRLLQAEDDK